MILAFLLLMACRTPEDCGWVNVAELPAVECARAGMLIAARYASDHPAEQVLGYRCVVVVTPEKEL
jgi:hypothetical protein